MSDQITEYTAAFLFDASGEDVVLIEKLRPSWQAGKLNAIGGHIEEGETPEECIRREYKEEAGVDVENFKKFCVLNGNGFRVHFFLAFDSHLWRNAASITDEYVGRYRIDSLPEYSCLPNLSWLIPMALSIRKDTADVFDITERYSEN